MTGDAMAGHPGKAEPRMDPFMVLPVEVCVVILQLGEPDLANRTRFLVQVGHVSKHWREVSLLPELWRHVWVDSPPQAQDLEGLRRVLERSGGRLESITWLFEFCPDLKSTDIDTLWAGAIHNATRHQCLREVQLVCLSERDFPADPQTVVEAIGGPALRVFVLRNVWHRTRWDTAYLDSLVMGVVESSPNLRSLSLCYIMLSAGCVPKPSRDRDPMPLASLKNLELALLSFIPELWERMAEAKVQLRSLTLGPEECALTPNISEPHMEHVRQILGERSLEQISFSAEPSKLHPMLPPLLTRSHRSFDACNFSASGPLLTTIPDASRLESLRISSLVLSELDFRRMLTPQPRAPFPSFLRELSLSYCPYSDILLAQAVSTVSPTLQVFTLKDSLHAAGMVMQALQSASDLTRLVLERCPKISESMVYPILGFGHFPNAPAKPACPRLRYLAVGGFSAQFLAAAQSAMTARFPLTAEVKNLSAEASM